MKDVLLDTHALLWRLEDNSRLSIAAGRAIDDARVAYVSVVSLWEITIKHAQGRLPQVGVFLDHHDLELNRAGLSHLPLTARYITALRNLPAHHKDPFDRMLIAQALTEEFPIVSNEALFEAYGIARVW